MHKMSKIVKNILYKFSKKIIFLNKYYGYSHKQDKTDMFKKKYRKNVRIPVPGSWPAMQR